ncbi:hypothetical protein F4561_006479 [Lipingzhangella halophila]|uniref:Uncharacterized protein n=1 Tax=Lipingzhangella halophila TaxID=1783352 RepID=A0A7W7RP47_9ACTN|nr:hypothetical protein [Lipingzhangella halophila]MBB4935585.1 hypothetical protein [Lipingzhangella halophila]
MGTTLAAEDAWVEERFAEIVAGLEGSGGLWAKIKPMGDDDEGPSREEDLEPWDDEDIPDDGDVEFP